MSSVVKLALKRPYTFVVMAILILIFGGVAALQTPTDIFPNIGIPVISVVWSYTGLPPDDMAGRIISPYERALSTTVNDIEHIESQSLPRLRRRQNLFPAERQHQRRAGAGHGDLADHPEATAAGRHPADHSRLQRLERADHPACAVERHALAGRALRSRAELHPARSSPPSPGAQLPYPYGGADAPGADRSRPERAARPRSFGRPTSAPRSPRQNLITPVGTEKIGAYEFTIDLNDSPKALDGLQQSAGQGGRRRRRLHARRRLCP